MVPVIVGVTGHRDLHADDVPRLKAAIGAELRRVLERCPHSRLVLLTPLAEGADRVAAAAALDAGVPLIVPLPLPQHLYEEDFQAPGSVEEFRNLLNRAESRIELGLLPGATLEGVRTAGPARDREYEKVGTYVAKMSHVFLACWDGRPAPSPTHVAGTAHAVAVRLKGAPYFAPASRFAALDSGSVVHIVTPRVSAPPVANAFSRSILVPADRTDSSIDRLLTELDVFNGDAAHHRAELVEPIIRSKAYLLHADPSAVDEAVQALPPSCATILDQYATADALAVLFRSRSVRALKQVFVGVFVSAVLFNLHASLYVYERAGEGEGATAVSLLATTPWALLGSLAVSAFTATWLYRRAMKAEYQNKHQDYRSLAEALRVQFFWLLAGIREPVVKHYLRRHRSDLEWIREALYSTALLMEARRGASDEAKAAHNDPEEMVRRLWVADQRAYYTSRASREQRELDREEYLSGWLLKLSIMATAVFAMLLTLPLVYPSSSTGAVRVWVARHEVAGTFEFVIVFLAVAAAMVLAYSEQLARAEHVRQYTRMGELFAAAERALDETDRRQQPHRTAEVILDLGKEALDEAGDWLILHRERPLEMPHG